eukprot:4569911-Amphidinium_carterae.1
MENHSEAIPSAAWQTWLWTELASNTFSGFCYQCSLADCLGYLSERPHTTCRTSHVGKTVGGFEELQDVFCCMLQRYNESLHI